MEITRSEHERGHVCLACGRNEVSVYADGVVVIRSPAEDGDISAPLVDALVEERLKQRGMMAVPLTTWEDESPKQIEVTVRQLMSND